MDTPLTQIGIIGAGELGKALGRTLTESHVQVLYYDKNPARTTTASIEDIIRSCQVLLLCVPSWEVKDVAKQISKASYPNEPRLVISLSKGVGPGFVTMDQLLTQHLPKQFDYGLLYGPMIAEEIDRGRSSSGVLALSNTKWFSQVRKTLGEAHICVESSGDMRGVAVCSVLKNVYAIGLGICDGLHLGLNAKGRLGTMILAEMKHVVGALNANVSTAEGLAGFGDLLATGFSDDSFNYRIGKSLAEGIADEHIKSEGLVTLQELGKVINLKQYPIIGAVDKVVFHYGAPSLLGDIVTGC